MVKILAPLFLLYVFTIAQAVEMEPLKIIQTKEIFTAEISGPQHLTLCADSLWTYSVPLNTIYQIGLKGELISPAAHLSDNKLVIKNPDIAGLACQKNALLILLNTKNKQNPQPQILTIPIHGKELAINSLIVRFIKLNKRATDLFCNETLCWLAQEKIYQSLDLTSWQEVKLPRLEDIDKANARPDLNPFEDWQDSLVIAKSQYLKGAVNDKNNLAFIDPFHAQIVYGSSVNWNKWGRFGAWEGSLLTPRNLIFLRTDVLAIADVRLKAIFVFKTDGTYLGLLGLDKNFLYSPEYPMGLAYRAGQIFVADFRGNQIRGLDLIGLQSSVETKSQLNVRQNLFRRSEVYRDHDTTLCLTCHDGTHNNQLQKFVKSPYHHQARCSECHDSHHQSPQKSYLKKPATELCMSCHKDHAEPATNHSWTMKKTGGNCLDCHRSHAESAKLLLKPSTELCISCHQSQANTHRQVSQLLATERAQGLRFDDGKVSCSTCHTTHKNSKKNKFLNGSEKLTAFCASCHGAKTEKLYQNFHTIMKTKGTR